MPQIIIDVFANAGWQTHPDLNQIDENKTLTITYLSGTVTTHPDPTVPQNTGPEGWWEPITRPDWGFWVLGAKRGELCVLHTWPQSDAGEPATIREKKYGIGGLLKTAAGYQPCQIKGYGFAGFLYGLGNVRPQIYFVVNDAQSGIHDNRGSFKLQLDWV